VSVATTFREELKKHGVIFCAISEAIREYPELVRQYVGSVVRITTTSSPRSTRPCSRRLVRVHPEGRALSDGAVHVLPHQSESTGQFERTLIVADDASHVSYLEGCSAPVRDENQLHAAVVELVALDRATIKYFDYPELVPGDEAGRGGIYNFVTKRGACRGRGSKISWTQVETGSAITWKYPGCILPRRRLDRRVLLSGRDQPPAAGGHRHQDDSHGQEHALDHRLQGHLGGARAEHLPGSGEDPEGRDHARNYRSATRC